jgi:hypothetical protein
VGDDIGERPQAGADTSSADHGLGRISPGVSIDIPVGTAFQYRCTGEEPLQFLCVARPPWPGEAEATEIEGPWVPTAPVDPVCSATAL